MRAALAMILFAGANVLGQPHNATTVVYPTGIWPDDGHNISVAASAGGTVVLKAVNAAGVPTAFNFGDQFRDRCSVWLDSADVTIIGERAGRNRATIHGGCTPFVVNGPVKVTIEDLDFDAPFGSAITVVAATGADIIGNHILSVAPIPLFFGSYTDGIDIFGGDSQALSGSVRVIGNTIENLGADFQVGMQIDDNVLAGVVITDNNITIGQTPGTGFVESDGLLALRCHSPVDIERNHVLVGPNFVFDAIAIAGNVVAAYRVKGNSIVSYSPAADGIVLIGGFFSDGVDGAVVSENSVEMHGSDFGAISAYGAVTHSEIGENQISGDSGWAFAVMGLGPVGSSNQILHNNLARHTSTVADVIFDAFTHDNVVDGMCASVIDEGTNNVISCRGAAGAGAHAPARHTRGVAGHHVVPNGPQIVH